MNKIKIFIIVFMVFLYADSYSEAMFAGNIVTVNPRSEVNALRNPSMMSRQKEDNISLIYAYSYLMNSDINSDVSISGTKQYSEYHLDESYNGSTFFSGVWVSGKSAYGLGISKTGDGQVKFSSSDLVIDTYKISQDNKYFGSTFLFSYSYRLNGKQSLGIQIETVVSNEYIEKENKSTEDKEIEDSRTKSSSGGTIGYYIHDNHFSFGAMLKPGMFGMEKRNYDLTNKTSGTEDHKKISSYYVHHEGVSTLLGVGIRPSNKLMFAFEGGGILPYTKEEKSCNDSLVQQTERTELSYAAIIRTGMDFTFNRFLTMGFGGGFTRYSADFSNTDNTKSGSFVFSIFQVSAGIDIKPSKDYHLLLGLSYDRLLQEMYMEDSGLSLDLDLVQDSLNITAGISCYY